MDAEIGQADGDGGRSLHQRIVADIEGRILSGEWPPGHRIPFEMELTEHYGCSRMTVNKALSQLAKAGLIERRKKSGSFVLQPHVQSAVLEIRDIREEVTSLGLDYGYHLISRNLRKAREDERNALELPVDARVIAIQCLHSAGGKPFCFEERLINVEAVPESRNETFAELAPGPWLIRQVPWSAAEHRILAVSADDRHARQLEIAKGSACLRIIRRTVFAGAYITRVELTYPGNAFELVASFAPTQV
ncbi:MAG: histidine utilization repressor [Pseudomonadota bacterium]|jgi:GntR family histidine utilization transcriptional repressor